MLYWFKSVLRLFGACELFRGASVLECSCAASPLLHVFSLVVFFTAAVSVAAGGESYSTATCGDLWAILDLTNGAFSAASTMSADVEAAFGGAEALGLVAVPAPMSVFFNVPLCHVCHACVLFFSAGGKEALIFTAKHLPRISLLGKVE